MMNKITDSQLSDITKKDEDAVWPKGFRNMARKVLISRRAREWMKEIPYLLLCEAKVSAEEELIDEGLLDGHTS